MKDANLYNSIEFRNIFQFSTEDTIILSSDHLRLDRLLKEFSLYAYGLEKTIELFKIITLESWIQDIAFELSMKSNKKIKYLDSFESKLIWRKMMKSKKSISYIKSLSKSIEEAYHVIHEWDLNIDLNDHADNKEYLDFLFLKKKYIKYLTKNKIEDWNTIYEKTIYAILKKKLVLPKNIIIFGFLEISPRIKRLLQALKCNECVIYSIVNNNMPTCYKYISSNNEEECAVAVKWILSELAKNERGKYAILSFNLEKDLNIIETNLNKTLNSLKYKPNICIKCSINKPLSSFNFIKALIAWVYAIDKSVYEEVHKPSLYGKALLFGYFYNDTKDYDNYSLLDVEWRQLSEDKISENELMIYIGKYGSLKDRLAKSLKIWKSVSNRATPHTWSLIISQILEIIGFPGERWPNIASIKHSTNLLLNRFSSISKIVGEIDGNEAILLFKELSNETFFKLNKHESRFSNFEILDPLDAIGGYWDGIWFLGLTNNVLPCKYKFNPFLPVNELKKFGVEKFTPEMVIRWSHILYENLKKSAKKFIVSYSSLTQNEQSQKPSKFIEYIPLIKISFLKSDFKKSPNISLEYISDESAPKIKKNQHISGGVDLLELQSRNPQWAFLKYRLKANQLKSYGSSNILYSRGKLLHKSLELVWSNLKDQSILKNMINNGSIKPLLKTIINEVFDSEFIFYPKKFIDLEKNRSLNLLYQWLNFETNRPNFTIEALEKKIAFVRGNLSINLIIDRIDRLKNDIYIIIDYKTGKSFKYKIADWTNDILTNLQLPLYCVAANNFYNQTNYIKGFAISHVYPLKFKHYGFSSVDTNIAGINKLPNSICLPETHSWESINSLWEKSLNKLMDEFISGFAKNYFANTEDMKYCDVLPFLRSYLEY